MTDKRLTLLLLLAACEPPPPAPLSRSASVGSSTTQEAPSAPGRLRVELDSETRAWLRDASITESRFARRTLFSWTKPATIARMRDDQRLFDDNVGPEGPSLYVRWLEHIAGRPRAVGRLANVLLGHPDMKRRRYAWSRPWATRLGFGPRDYGDQLIAIELKATAIVGRFNPLATPVWRFQDLDHQDVPLGRVLADPSRIAAIHHVHRGEPQIREIVLCNESMIARWSVASELGQRAIDEDVKRLRALASLELPELFGAGQELDDDGALLVSALAFQVGPYQPTRANLERIAERLESSQQLGLPLQVEPVAEFDHNAAPELVVVRRLPPRMFPFDA